MQPRAHDWQLPDGMRVGFTSTDDYSSRCLTDLLARDDMYQRRYVSANLTMALRDARDRWELAAIGNNLSNELLTGNCTNRNAEARQVLGGQSTGPNLPPARAGVDELAWQLDLGRQAFVRLTLRPIGLFR